MMVAMTVAIHSLVSPSPMLALKTYSLKSLIFLQTIWGCSFRALRDLSKRVALNASIFVRKRPDGEWLL